MIPIGRSSISTKAIWYLAAATALLLLVFAGYRLNTAGPGEAPVSTNADTGALAPSQHGPPAAANQGPGVKPVSRPAESHATSDQWEAPDDAKPWVPAQLTDKVRNLPYSGDPAGPPASATTASSSSGVVHYADQSVPDFDADGPGGDPIGPSETGPGQTDPGLNLDPSSITGPGDNTVDIQGPGPGEGSVADPGPGPGADDPRTPPPDVN